MHPATRTSTTVRNRTAAGTARIAVRAARTRSTVARPAPPAGPALATVTPLFRTGSVTSAAFPAAQAPLPAAPVAPVRPAGDAPSPGAGGDLALASALGLVCGSATVQLARLSVALQPPAATAALAVGVAALGALAVQRAATGSPRRRLAFLAAALVALPVTTVVDGVRWSPTDVACYAVLAGATLATAVYANARTRLARTARPTLQVVRSR